jgi:CRISPR-associated protein Cas2
MFFVITYDVANDRNRTKLSALLDAYGIRVNYSVYECELSDRKLEHLLYEIDLKNLINKKYDSLRFYHIHKTSIQNSFDIAQRSNPFDYESMYV